MPLTGLRVSELCSLRWRAVDLARARLTVERSKTEAGEGRVIDLAPLALDELKVWRASRRDVGDDDFVFPTKTGMQRDRHSVRSRVLLPALARANKARTEAGLRPIAHVTNHTLRRTFASLLYDAGATTPEVMGQIGHTSAALALEVYSRRLVHDGATAQRMDALVRGDRTLGDRFHARVGAHRGVDCSPGCCGQGCEAR